TAMGTAFPRGFAQQAPLSNDARFGGLPPSVAQQVAAEGAFDPLSGLGRALDWASGPIPRNLAPPGGLPSWLSNAPDANPLERLGYALERTRGAEQTNPEAFAGQKGLGEMTGNPLSYVGWGLPGQAAAKVQSPLLRQILSEAQGAETAFMKVPGEVLGTAWDAAQGLPVIGGALQQSKRAAAGIGEDAMRGIISGLDTAASQFPELQGTSPWRLLAGMKGVTKDGQVARDDAVAAIKASSVDARTLQSWGSQAEQDKTMLQEARRLISGFKPSITEPVNLLETRTALEAKAGVTAADTDALLQQALPRVPEVLETPKPPEWYTSADLGKAVRLVQEERLAADGGGAVVEEPLREAATKAVQTAWLQQTRYGDIFPATIGRGPAKNEAAVAARIAHQGSGGAAPGGSARAGAAAPSASAPPQGIPFGSAQIDRKGMKGSTWA